MLDEIKEKSETIDVSEQTSEENIVPDATSQIEPIASAVTTQDENVCKEVKLVSGMFYFYGDHLGSSSVVTDSAGKVVQTTDYYPYGGVRHEFTDESFENDFLYTGKELDEELGIYYYGARYYMADVGRWMGEDPMVLDFNRDQLNKLLNDPQSWNAYAYVRNNPVLNIDPDGADWRTKLNNAANKVINVATAVIPGVSDARDFIEFQTGKDAVYQTPLSQEQKDMAGFFVLLPFISGSEGRMGVKALRKVDEGIERSIQNNIESINNIIDNHLQSHDWAGLIRDVSDNPVYSEKLGRYFDHFKEVGMDAQKGLVDRSERLLNYVRQYKLDENIVGQINQIVDKANKVVDRIQNIIKSH